MRKKNNEFLDIQLAKDLQYRRILEQERAIKNSFRELKANVTGESMKSRIQENMLSGSGLAFKLGFIAVTLLQERFRKKRKK
jgi:hypothetical protein